MSASNTQPQMIGDTKKKPTVRKRVLVLGATGTIGRATTHALIHQGHDVVCVLRPRPAQKRDSEILGTAALRFGDVSDPQSLQRNGFCGERFDAVISCMASRTGTPKDAWAIDHDAHMNVLAAALDNGVGQMVLLSAICVQKPVLEFQRAKLAFEAALIDSGLAYSIVRPTAYFKSLAGQLDRVRQGKPFLLFGDGRMTACKPISDADLATYLVACLDNPERINRVLPVGGPGEAITPREQGEFLFSLVNRRPRFRHVPVAFLDAISLSLGACSRFAPSLSDKSEFAKIGRYYATESMLLLNPKTGQYDAAATPSTGTETLFDFYTKAMGENLSVDRGDHAVF